MSTQEKPKCEECYADTTAKNPDHSSCKPQKQEKPRESSIEKLGQLLDESGVKVSFDIYRDTTKGCGEHCRAWTTSTSITYCPNHLSAIMRGDYLIPGGFVASMLENLRRERDEWKESDAVRKIALQTALDAGNQLIKERDAFRTENSKLQAQLYVAKDSQLRTYDGLSERAALADKLESQLNEAIAALEQILELNALDATMNAHAVARETLAKLRGEK